MNGLVGAGEGRLSIVRLRSGMTGGPYRQVRALRRVQIGLGGDGRGLPLGKVDGGYAIAARWTFCGCDTP